MKNILLSVKNLTLSYSANIVIQNANFEVETGDFVCVVGANGSGKSTLIKGILGLIKPISGQIVFQNGLSQQNIGYFPQENKLDAFFPATVKEIVLSGTLGQLKFKPFYGKAEKVNAKNSLKLLGISQLQNQSFTRLSGGQKQKVLLARACAATSKLLILDEPSNNLDYNSRQDFYRTLKKLNRQGITIIMITHDLDSDDLIGNKIIALKDGHTQLTTTKAYLRSFQK